MTGVFPKQKFYEHQRINPFWSDWTCFCETIKGKKDLKSKTIKRYFNQLVDKNDYDQEDKLELIKFLLDLRSS